MERYRIGIVGAGFGVKLHWPALARHPRFSVVAIASPTSARRIAVGGGSILGFTSCAEMLERCPLDAVVIASPPFAHRDDVLAAAARRTPFLCEKPFALGVAEAEAMVAAAKTARVACGVVHEFRWAPAVARLRERVAGGEIGALRGIEVSALSGICRVDTPRPRGWWFRRDRGGGIAGAILSHLIDGANLLAGCPPVRVTGVLRTANPRRADAEGNFTTDVDDGAFALLDYGAGLVGRISADGTSGAPSHVFAAHGERGSLLARGPHLVPSRLVHAEGERETTESFDDSDPDLQLALLGRLYDELVAAMEGKPHALPTLDEALATQRALAALGYGS